METATLEASLIGVCLNNEQDACKAVYGGLKTEHFSCEDTRRIWSVIWTLIDQEKQADLPTVASLLPDLTLKLTHLVVEAPRSGDVAVWSDAIKDRARDRAIIAHVEKALRKVRDKERFEPFGDPGTTNSAFDDVFAKLYTSEENPVEIGPDEAFARLEKIWEEEHANGYKTVAIPTGFAAIDEAMAGGISRGAIMTLAAKTGQGKSMLAINIGLNAALAGYKVLYVTVEMDWRETYSRIISSYAEKDYSKVLRGPRSNQEFDGFANTWRATTKKDFYVFDKSYRKIEEVEKRVRFAAVKRPYDLVIIDYIGQFKLYDTYMRPHEQIGHVSAFIKSEIAKRHNVAVLSVAQMNRNAEAEGESGMRLGNIADAAGIERDSDVVAILVRDDAENSDISWLRFSKQRHGKPGRVALKFNGQAARFEDVSKDELDNYYSQKQVAKSQKTSEARKKFSNLTNIQKHWMDNDD